MIKIYHLSLNLLLHYLAKFECWQQLFHTKMVQKSKYLLVWLSLPITGVKVRQKYY